MGLIVQSEFTKYRWPSSSAPVNTLRRAGITIWMQMLTIGVASLSK